MNIDSLIASVATTLHKSDPTPENIEAAIAAYEAATLALGAAMVDSRIAWMDQYAFRTSAYRAEATALLADEPQTQTTAMSAAFWRRDAALNASAARVECCHRNVELTEGEVRRLLGALAALTTQGASDV
jgi:hypothetical protein